MADTSIVQAHLYGDVTAPNHAGIFWTDANNGYFFYVDNTNRYVYYIKTEDGGSTWETPVQVKDTDCLCFDCWADWETPNDDGTKIHVAILPDYPDTAIVYVNLDTSTDTLSTPNDCDVKNTGDYEDARQWNNIHITKTISGKIFIAWHTLSGSYAMIYSSNGTTWYDMSVYPCEGAGDDWYEIYPTNDVSNPDDIWCLFFDKTSTALTLKVLDFNGDTWDSETSVCTMNAAGGIDRIPWHAAIRHSDGHLLAAVWSEYDSTTADLLCFDIDGSGTPSISQETNILTDQSESCLVVLLIDQRNDDVYVAYAKGGTVGTSQVIYYKKSADDMSSWGSEQGYMEASGLDTAQLYIGSVKKEWGGWWMPVYNNNDTYYEWCNLNNCVEFEPYAHEAEVDSDCGVSDAVTPMVVLSAEVYDEVDCSENVVAGNDYCVSFVSNNTPSIMQAGQTYSDISITLRNTSNQTWIYDGTYPVKLSYHIYDRYGNQVLWDGERTSLPYDINAGDTIALTCTVIAPSTPNLYTITWDVVKEGTTWFSQYGSPVDEVEVGVYIKDDVEVTDVVEPLIPALTAVVIDTVEISEFFDYFMTLVCVLYDLVDVSEYEYGYLDELFLSISSSVDVLDSAIPLLPFLMLSLLDLVEETEPLPEFQDILAPINFLVDEPMWNWGDTHWE